MCCSQHAHVSRGEVIGLLGGTYNEEDKVLKVRGFVNSHIDIKAGDSSIVNYGVCHALA